VPEPKALAPHLVIVATSEQAGEAEADDRLHDRVLCRKHRRRETGGVRLPSDGNRWIGIGVMRGAIAKRLLAAGYAVSHAPPLRRRVWSPST
jgi:hypothetical protein